MASENWKVLRQRNCEAWVEQVTTKTETGTKSVPSTKFLMDVKATIRRSLAEEPTYFHDGVFQDEDNWSVDENDDEVGIRNISPHEFSLGMSQTLCKIQVPSSAHEKMLDDIIIPQVFRAARDHGIYAAPNKVLHMKVRIDVYVADKNLVPEDEFWGMDGWEEKLVPASEAGIEKLEKARVEVLTMCSVCLEEIEVGAEATRLPCELNYHEGCIVEWLHKSRFCPLCRHAMPAGDEEAS